MTASAGERIRLAERLRRDAFPDLWFTRSDQAGPFVWNLDLRCDALRLRLERPDFLHLAAVSLLGPGPEGAPARVAEARSVRVDGEPLGAPWLPWSGFAPGREWVSFHSGNTKPELLLEFDPFDLRQIRLENRPDGWAERAWSLVVEAHVPGEGWRRVYRHARRERRFRATLRAAPGGPLDPALREAVDACSLAAMRLDPALQAALAALARSHGPRMLAAARAALNEAILLPRRREVTVHGLQRTFRFWSEAEKRALLTQLGAVHRILARRGVPSVLGYGALLGFVRGGDLIPHDDDVDLLAVVPAALGPEGGLARVARVLEEAGLRAHPAGPHNIHVLPPVGEKAAPVDLFLARQDGDRALLFPARRREVELAHLLPHQMAGFLGAPVPIPANPFELLEAFYGPGWRTPDPQHAHDWRAG